MGNKNNDCKYELTGKIDKYLTFAYSEQKLMQGAKGRTDGAAQL